MGEQEQRGSYQVLTHGEGIYVPRQTHPVCGRCEPRHKRANLLDLRLGQSQSMP